MKFFYEDVLKAVGEFGPWQVKMIFFLWVPMFMCQVESIDSSNALKTPIVKEEKVEEEHEAKTGIKTKTKKRKSKERRRERLLKYHEKLVKTNGLPPSRLMKQRLEQESSVLGEGRKKPVKLV